MLRWRKVCSLEADSALRYELSRQVERAKVLLDARPQGAPDERTWLLTLAVKQLEGQPAVLAQLVHLPLISGEHDRRPETSGGGMLSLDDSLTDELRIVLNLRVARYCLAFEEYWGRAQDMLSKVLVDSDSARYCQAEASFLISIFQQTKGAGSLDSVVVALDDALKSAVALNSVPLTLLVLAERVCWFMVRRNFFGAKLELEVAASMRTDLGDTTERMYDLSEEVLHRLDAYRACVNEQRSPMDPALPWMPSQLTPGVWVHAGSIFSPIWIRRSATKSEWEWTPSKESKGWQPVTELKVASGSWKGATPGPCNRSLLVALRSSGTQAPVDVVVRLTA